MQKSFEEMLNDKAETYRTERSITSAKDQEVWEAKCDALYDMLMGQSKAGRSMSFKEAITSRDFPLLFKTVVDERIMMPREPEYIGQNLLATTISVGQNFGQYRVPVFGFMTAGEVGEGGEYPEAFSALSKDNTATVPLKKYGIRIAITEEAKAADEMGLYGMYLLGGKMAMNRLKEEQIFSLFKHVALPVFDNKLAWGDNYLTTVDLSTINSNAPYDAKFNTRGRGADGNYNGTLHIFDVIDTMATVMVRGYTPTDMLVNPLAWAILARNPILNGFYNRQFALPQQAVQAPQWSTGPQDLNSIPMPWAMTLHVTPFVPVNYTDTGSAPYVTDIYIGARQNGILLLQGQTLQQDGWEDFPRDVTNVRFKEMYGVGLADMGRSWGSIRNVRIDASYEYVVTKLVGG